MVCRRVEPLELRLPRAASAASMRWTSLCALSRSLSQLLNYSRHVFHSGPRADDSRELTHRRSDSDSGRGQHDTRVSFWLTATRLARSRRSSGGRDCMRRGDGEEFSIDPVVSPERLNRARLVGVGQFVRHLWCDDGIWAQENPASGRLSSDLTGARKEGSNEEGGYTLREKFGYTPGPRSPAPSGFDLAGPARARGRARALARAGQCV